MRSYLVFPSSSLRFLGRGFPLAATVIALCTASVARAESTIRHPGDRTDYVFEAEPHLLLGYVGMPGLDNSSTGLGLGFRGTVQILENGFIKSINNSVGIGFGVDWLHYSHSDWGRGYCTRWEPGAPGSGTRICAETSSQHHNYWMFPLVLQWNFWLSDKFSVFGEPGVAIYHNGQNAGLNPFVIWGGGRFQITENITLTARIGIPSLSFGVSFLL